MPQHIICTVTNDLVYDQRMIRICTALVDAGYQVTLVGREKTNSKELSKQAFEQVRLKVSAQQGKFFYMQFHFALKRWLLSQKYDILYSVDLDTLMACGQVSKKRHIPLVYDAHEYFTEVPELLGRPYVKAIWAWIAKKYIPQASICITVSETLGEVLSQKYNKPFEIIRNVPFFRESIKIKKSTPKIILYQGVLNKGRGIEASIQAMKYLDGVVLWLVGMGDLERELQQLVIHENLVEKVIFKGHIQPQELPQITNQAWLGINLLEGKSLNYYYSLANKFFDYMMAGVPSLNMNFPEYTQILSLFPMGMTTETLVPQKIANIIQELLDNPTTYTQMVQATRKGKEIFNWHQEQQKLIQVLNGLSV